MHVQHCCQRAAAADKPCPALFAGNARRYPQRHHQDYLLRSNRPQLEKSRPSYSRATMFPDLQVGKALLQGQVEMHARKLFPDRIISDAEFPATARALRAPSESYTASSMQTGHCLRARDRARLNGT